MFTYVKVLLDHLAYAKIQTNFTFFWIFLDPLVSVNIHVIRIITWNLADEWYIIFSSDPTNISLCVGIGIGNIKKYSQIKVLCTVNASNYPDSPELSEKG